MDYSAFTTKLEAGELDGLLIEGDLLNPEIVAANEMPEMSDDEAAMLAGHVFSKVFPEAKVSQNDCLAYDHEEGEWSGNVFWGVEDGGVAAWEIERDGDDFLMTFSELED